MNNTPLRLHDIFLRKFLLLFITMFLILGVIFYVWIKDIYIEQTKTDLLHNIDIISVQIEDFEHLDTKITKLKRLIDLRITIINKEGTVIAESHKDKDLMYNHQNRSEIIQSKYQNYGSIIRYSNTLEKELLYVSKKFTLNNQQYYIRMARDIEQINQQFLSLGLKIGFLFLLFMASAFWISLRISKNVQDETQQILEFLKNLTEQKKELKIDSTYSFEFKKITNILTQLSHNLAKKNKQKSKYTAKLKLSNRQKDDIISAISHEFKNPIAVISGYTQTLIEDKKINPTIRDKFLTKISSNSLKLTNMIDQLRLSLKLEQKKQTSVFTSCNITHITTTIIEDLKITYPSRQIELHAKDIYIDADLTMITIAITNLIENALKYSQDAVEIEITEKSLDIKDHGIGISKADLSKVTDKFYRVSSNGWNNSLGVGLFLVKSIIDIHKFKLAIHSIENEGSTFSIVFN
ncbi:MAG: ATP-binding protein [Campylobacterota bacterium]|nr:ATP-binding protein [Campylobacterota bacterium]